LIGDRTATAGDAAKRPYRPRSNGHPQRPVNRTEFAREACSGLPVGTAASSTGRPPRPQSQSLSEVTDPICRLPLPTLFYRPEAVHLGDLLRILGTSWRESAVTSPGFSRSSRLLVDAERTSALFAQPKPILRARRFKGLVAYAEKTTLPELRPASPGRVALPRRIRGSESVPRPGSRIWTGFPFGVTVAHSIEVETPRV